MNCKKAQEWISLQIDSQLPAQHVPLLQQHLTACADCRLYCDDVLLGRRLFAATQPVPPDNFDWKLQLRLNHAMREAARDVQFPWSRPLDRWRFWMTRAGLAAPLGLAAVMVFSLLLPARTLFAPEGQRSGQVAAAERPARLPYKEPEQILPLFDSSRRPLDAPLMATTRQPGLGVQRSVSTGGVLSQRAWSTSGSELDVARIRQLEQSVEALRRLLDIRDLRIQMLDAKLDSLERLSVDTGKEN